MFKAKNVILYYERSSVRDKMLLEIDICIQIKTIGSILCKKLCKALELREISGNSYNFSKFYLIYFTKLISRRKDKVWKNHAFKWEQQIKKIFLLVL